MCFDGRGAARLLLKVPIALTPGGAFRCTTNSGIPKPTLATRASAIPPVTNADSIRSNTTYERVPRRRVVTAWRGRWRRGMSGPGPSRAGVRTGSGCWREGLFVVVVLTMLAAGCTSKTTPSESASAPAVSLPMSAPSRSPADVRAAAVQAAVAAYRGMWQAYNAAIEVPDPNNADLARYATGNALSGLVATLTSVKKQGLKGTGQLVLSPHVTGISPINEPATISVQDCFDDSGTHVVAASPGASYHDTPGGRRICVATVERQPDGTWKVTKFTLQGVGSC